MRAPALIVSGVVVASLLSPAAADAVTTTEGASHSAAITKTAARKIVNAGVIKKTDVSGFTAQRYVGDPSDDATQKALYKCLGGKPPKEVMTKDGPTLSKGAMTIDSGAAVIATVKQARADMKLAQSKRARGCLKKAIVTSVEADGAVVHGITVKLIKVTVPGADIAFGYRYDLLATADDVTFGLLGYDLNALVGQTELNVSPARFDGRLPSLKQGITLLTKTVKRVRALD